MPSRPGPPKKPTALKLIDGTYRPDLDGPLEEQVMPEPVIGLEPPEWLGDLAREEWERTLPRLERLGVLAEIDATILAAYCAAVEAWRRADVLVLEHGELLETRDGYKANPAVGMAERSRAQAARFAGELGMTPAARAILRKPRTGATDGATAPRDGKKAAARRILD